jgi:hypothetical protein
MTRCFRISSFLILIVLTATAASADWGVLRGPGLPPFESQGTCVPGNLEQITVAGPTIEVGGQSILLVDPATGFNCTCDIGLDFYWIRAVVWVDSDCDVTVRAKLYSEDLVDPACPGSGKLECTGPDTLFKLSAGFNSIVFPMGDCPCADSNFLYGIGFELVSTTCGEVRRTSDAVSPPGPSCTSFYIGSGGTIVDEANLGIPGRLGINALAGCCNQPIGTGVDNWGTLKKHYDE